MSEDEELTMNVQTCPHCAGHGQVPQYTGDGSDFLGPKECPECKGSGLVLARDAKGRFVKQS